jgi:hypothetical protein
MERLTYGRAHIRHAQARVWDARAGRAREGACRECRGARQGRKAAYQVCKRRMHGAKAKVIE